jgi:hypothetical protein
MRKYVKIIKTASDVWYKFSVGKIFEVNLSDMPGCYDEVVEYPGRSCGLLISDCEDSNIIDYLKQNKRHETAALLSIYNDIFKSGYYNDDFSEREKEHMELIESIIPEYTKEITAPYIEILERAAE